MVRPSVEPTSVCLRSEPGEIRALNVVIAKAPTGATVTASIINGDSLVTLKHVVAFELTRRPATEEEIEELPRFPPSIREKFRRNGVEEYVEVRRSDGSTPLAVSAGFTVQFHLEFSALQQQAPDVTVATLIIEGTTLERVEVPVFFLIGKATTIPNVEPTDIRRAAEPGEILTQDVVIANVPSAAKIMAFIANGGPIIRLQKVIAFRPVKRKYTEEEIEELPPFLRENARKNGYTEHQETGRADGSSPLTVAKGEMLRVYLEFSAPEQQAPDFTVASLVIEGTTWQHVEVPLFLIIGKITTSLSTNSLSVRQGESDALGIQVTSVAGPSTDVDYQIGDAAQWWRIEPPTIYVARGSTVSSVVKVVVTPIAPEGIYAAGLEVRSFERLLLRRLPFQLTVRPSQVFVRVLQTSLVATQGDRIACGIEVISRGGYKKMTFTPGALPRGVRMEAPVQDYYGNVKTVIDVHFVVDPQARPVTNALLTIGWSAGDGEHAGTLELSFTVLVRLETKSFGQPIVTGAALGGQVNMILQNDGNCRFSGFMRATGFPSYQFRLRAVVRSASGRVAVMAQKTGEVFGTDTPGDRQLNWDEPVSAPFIVDPWPDLRAGAMTVNRSTELTGTLGTLADFMGDVLEFVAAAALLSPTGAGLALAGLVFLGSELGSLAGVRVVGPGGLVGVGVAGGVAFVLGPGMIIPAFVAGVLVGNLVIEHRSLNESEKRLARNVFGDTLPFDRILLTNLSGESGQEFTVPNIDSSILVNLGNGFDNPETHVDPPRGYAQPGQILIHELVHAWQIAHTPFVSELIWEVTLDKVEGQAAYRYGPPGPPWSSFTLEQQASIVDEWFAGTNVQALNPVPGRTPMNLNDPYFGYIANNIRLGQA